MPNLHLLGSQQESAPRCYLSLRLLPPKHYPVYVYREGGRTLLINDPRASRIELTERNVALLTTAEANLYRAAYGCPPIGQPMPDSIMEGPALLYVPPPLRLANEQAMQGGQELLRRWQAGEMADELALVAAEVQRAESA